MSERESTTGASEQAAVRTVFYAFASHARWSGAQWLRGYGALPGAVSETLAVVEGAGVCANLHCDGVGFERLAAEAPDVLAALRDAIGAEHVEIVGGTYGLPVGLFHGGESSVRQRVFGVRVARRLLGTTPRVALEAQFGCFPQLPQILAGCGFRGAGLTYARTWSAPQVPLEAHPLVQWKGLDGTRLPTLAHTAGWLGPFPGELERVRRDGLPGPDAAGGQPLVLLQWFELGVEPGWPADAKGVLSGLRALQSEPGLRIEAPGASELIERLAQAGEPPERASDLDQLYHGASLGKNGDYVPRYSRMAEEQLVAAEAAATLASLFGRPYAGWTVYPSWELEEAWRDLLVAQSQDVHEREGLVGSVGERSFERSLGLSGVCLQRSLSYLAGRAGALEGSSLVFNPLGWTRDVPHQDGVVPSVPPYGYKVVDPYELEESPLGRIGMHTDEREVVLERGPFRVTIDRTSGLVRQLQSESHPQGILDPERPLMALSMLQGGKPERFETVGLSTDSVDEAEFAEFVFLREGRGGSRVRVTYSLSPLMDALWVRVHAENLARPDGGVAAGLRTSVEPAFDDFELVHDHPYGISIVGPGQDRSRVQPLGHWAEGEREREDVRRPFTALSLVDLLEVGPEDGGDGSGLLVVHDGTQSWFRRDGGVEALVSMYDPWDAAHWDNVFEAEFFFVPHGPLSDTDRAMISMELNLGSPRFEDHAVAGGGGELPTEFGALSVDSESVLPTALYREHRRVAERVPGHFASTVRDPLVVRLVEYDGSAADVVLRVPGPVARAARTTFLGEVREELVGEPCEAPFGPPEMPWTALRLRLRPHEIATVMLDAELGRELHAPREAQRRLWS